jgi:hypothetical protein
MATYPHNTTPARNYRGVGVASVALGFFGLVFMFVAPLGAVLSTAGLLAGVVGWVLARPERRPGLRWAMWGTLLSLVALVLNLAILRGLATSYPYPLYGGW